MRDGFAYIVGFVGLLTVAFIVLKLCEIINWSWIWVISPMWISTLLFIVVVVIACIVDNSDY